MILELLFSKVEVDYWVYWLVVVIIIWETVKTWGSIYDKLRDWRGSKK